LTSSFSSSSCNTSPFFLFLCVSSSYSAGEIISKLALCVKRLGRSQANILEGVAQLVKEHKNTIEAMRKASHAEKERCRAAREKV